MTKISPDLVQILSGHKESIGVFQKGNTSHPLRVFTGAPYRFFPKKQILKQNLKRIERE
jgi:hypothetical protein